MANPFFKNHGPFKITELIKLIKSKDLRINDDLEISDIKDLYSSKKGNITFFHSKKYKDLAQKTKASFCITTENLKDDISKNCIPIIVSNVLVSTSIITSKFYPSSLLDNFDDKVDFINETKFKNSVKFGKNVLIGANVSIGKNCSIGHNTIIEKNVSIDDNCSIGSNVVIRNSIIKKNIRILDNCIIGKHGFGFFPNKDKNNRYPHIGAVIIEDNCEIGCSATIDRGSLSNTVIGENTYLDNQVHIAHNVKIGKNCMIAGQVGFAGSTTIGNNVSIGGQAGISGHLTIGDNVKIGGGSGVVKNIENNEVVMGYPAVSLKEFLKKNERDRNR